MTLTRTLFNAAVLLAAVMVAGAAAASDTGSSIDPSDPEVSNLRQALQNGVLGIDLRYRLEFVDSESFDKDALASTLRGALSYETAPLHGLFAGVTFETVTAIGNDKLYDNAGRGDLWNEVTDRPVVADPALVEVDQLFIAYRGAYGLDLRAGRFAFTLDNQRFIGIAPWRQNHRSYEAASIAIGSQDTLVARYAYLGRAYYNSGADQGLDGHLIHLSRALGPGSIAGYGYLIDWDDEVRAPLSSATYGARFVGSTELRRFDLLYFAEYARQLDFGDNPRDFSLDYAHVGLGARTGAWTLRAAWELRDGDGTSAVQTPLGTNHGKNGFADRMVVTPPDGSHDYYVRLAMDRDRWSWLVDYHIFEAARGGERQGTELDLQIRFSPTKDLDLYLKGAHYMADTWLTDVTKVMMWASWSFDTSF
ncbi:MAG: alginate export family protein [Holophagae bacterium]|jgi:hypothetical protein